MYVYFTLLYSAFIKQPDEYTGCVQSKYWRHICLLSGFCAQVCCAEAGADVRSQAWLRLEGCNMLILILTSFLSVLYNAIYVKLGPEEALTHKL